MSEETAKYQEKTEFQRYKEEGLTLVEEGKLSKALRSYAKALSKAETDEERAEIWQLVVHIHTGRLIKASAELSGLLGYPFTWPWGPNNIPSTYSPPSRDEALK